MQRLLGLPVFLTLLSGLWSCGEDPTLAEVNTQVFSVSCVFSSCHSGPTPRAGLNLTSEVYQALVGVPSTEKPSAMRVVAGAPDASFLLDKLLGRNLPQGPANEPEWTAMPPDGRLEDQRIDLIRDWIEAGALP